MTQGNLGLCLHYARQNNLSNAIELRPIAKEAGFANGDFVKQTYELGAVHGSRGQAFVILAKRAHSQGLHSFIAAGLENLELVIGLKKDSGLLSYRPYFQQRGRG